MSTSLAAASHPVAAMVASVNQHAGVLCGPFPPHPILEPTSCASMGPGREKAVDLELRGFSAGSRQSSPLFFHSQE